MLCFCVSMKLHSVLMPEPSVHAVYIFGHLTRRYTFYKIGLKFSFEVLSLEVREDVMEFLYLLLLIVY